MHNRKLKHIAIIMDGNGRWAKRQGVDRLMGHKKGAVVALEIVKHAGKRGIPYLTFFTFSSENWSRPHEEVQGLMGILYEKLLKDANSLVENGVKLQTIGAMEKLPLHVQEALAHVKGLTSHCTKLTLTLALSYGGRDEILRASKKAVQKVMAGQLSLDKLDEECFASFLDTALLPDPDLIVRTSGENRLSNFLLWQSSYAELLFLKMFWPDFGSQDFDDVLAEFAARERRFGKIDAEKDIDQP
jgi:undecaprenyl diphosphate synthase